MSTYSNPRHPHNPDEPYESDESYKNGALPLRHRTFFCLLKNISKLRRFKGTQEVGIVLEYSVGLSQTVKVGKERGGGEGKMTIW